MRTRMVAIHVGLFVVLTIAGCATPVAQACPVCDQYADGVVLENGTGAVNSTVTVEVGDSGPAEWTVVNDVSPAPNRSLASSERIEDRVRSRIRHGDADGTLETLDVDVQGEDRVVLTYTISGTSHDGPGDVVIYDGFAVDDRYAATEINAETFTVRGPGERVYSTDGGAGTRRDGAVQYEREDHLETDTLVVFGLESGVRGSLQLRGALLEYHGDRLPIVWALLLVPPFAVFVALWFVARLAGSASGGAAFEDGGARAAIAVVVASITAIAGLRTGVMPISAITTALAAGTALLALAARAGLGSRRLVVPIALCGTVGATAIVGVVVGLLGGGVASSDASAVVGEPAAIATPASIGFGHAVWSTLVAAAMAFGAAGHLDHRGHLLGALGVGAVVYGVLLAWWWPIVAPISVGGYAVSGVVVLVAMVAIGALAYGLGYAFRAPEADHDEVTA